MNANILGSLMSIGGFKGFDMEAFQTLGFGLIEMFGGPSVPEVIEGTADDFKAMEDLFTKAATIARICKEAVADGFISNDELEKIVAEAENLDDLLDVLTERVKDTLGIGGDDAGGD